MGNFYTNVTLRNAERQAVIEHMRAQGRSCFVSPTYYGFTTIYDRLCEEQDTRDLEALAMAGVPVYSQAGRGGGWSLVGGARTDLSGLNAAEARALFLVAGPGAATARLTAGLRLRRSLVET